METSIRESLIGLVNTAYIAAYPTIPIVFDNVAFDRNSPPAMWAEFSVAFAGGDQIGMAFAPKTRIHGFVYVSIWCREGAGWRKAALMRDWFAAQLEYKATGGVNLQAAEPVGGKGPTGWDVQELKVYFYANPT